MKIGYALLLVLGITCATYAQVKKNTADSIINKHLPTHKIDSASQHELKKLDSIKTRINFKMDSLRKKGLPVVKYRKKLDSVNRQVKNLVSMQALSATIKKDQAKLKAKIRSPQDSLRKKISRREQALQRILKKKTSKLDSLTAKAQLPTGNVKLPGGNMPNLPTNAGLNLPTTQPNLNVPSVNLLNETNELNKLSKNLTVPTAPSVPSLNGEIKKIETLPGKELSQSGIGKEVNELKNETKEVQALEKQAAQYKTDLKKIKEGDSARMASLKKDGEKLASNTKELKELKKEEAVVQTQKNAFEQYEDMLKDMKSGKGLKDASTISTRALPNPFIGQEEKLQAGINQLNQLKKKYKNVPDSRYLPKFVPNEVKGKPWKERLVPGFGLQVYQSTNVGVDLSAYLMYRVTGRVRLGAGISDRLVVDTKQHQVSSGHVQAFRFMADVRTLPGLYVHGEEEFTHFDLSSGSVYRTRVDPPAKEWSTRFNAGVLKTYRISQRINGQTQLLYNTSDWSNFPQAKNTTIRFGFEYKLGVQKKKNK